MIGSDIFSLLEIHFSELLCHVSENGTIVTWGWGEHGQLGLGDTCDRMIPQTVMLESRRLDAPSWFRVYCGSGFTIAVGKTNLHSQS